MIDLHTHSTASDGSFTPTQLIEEAHRIGLSAIALTDHDVVDGLSEFTKAAEKYPSLKAIGGAELGVEHPANVEILALNIKNLTPYFERQKQLLQWREDANRERVRLLQKAGYQISWQDVSVDENGGQRKTVAKPHFATFLYNSGQVENMEFVYKSLLAKGCSAYVRKKDADVAETIDFIRQTGAVSVLAHPCLIRLKGQDLFNEIVRLKSMGLQGMEVMHSDMTDEQMAEYHQIADVLGLVKSGGSDFHGINAHINIRLGVGRGNLNIPDVFLDRILEI